MSKVSKLHVAVLGATGIVGQRFLSLLYKHPWFEITVITASRSKAGKKYSEAVEWVISNDVPEELKDMRLQELSIEKIVAEKPDVVFVALPSSVAVDIEPVLAKKGLVIVSNASCFRREKDIPVIIPEINSEHLDIIDYQRQKRGWEGFIVKVPNCTSAILSLSLKPILDAYGISEVYAVSMQGLSGAGLHGVSSLEIIDNILPYIPGEEEKLEYEPKKILGKTGNGVIIERNDIRIYARCTRVPVLEGHSISVLVKTHNEPKSIDEIINIYEGFNGLSGLPTASEKPVIVHRSSNRPQPRLDRMNGNGMSVSVGRISIYKGENKIKYFVVGSNTIRGAAGNAILIAELLKQRKMI